MLLELDREFVHEVVHEVRRAGCAHRAERKAKRVLYIPKTKKFMECGRVALVGGKEGRAWLDLGRRVFLVGGFWLNCVLTWGRGRLYPQTPLGARKKKCFF